ncbi:hypothetical protein [Mycobacterium kiyosense]
MITNQLMGEAANRERLVTVVDVESGAQHRYLQQHVEHTENADAAPHGPVTGAALERQRHHVGQAPEEDHVGQHHPDGHCSVEGGVTVDPVAGEEAMTQHVDRRFVE